MAISNNEHEQLKQILNQFSDLYRNKVEYTGEKIRKVNSFRVPINPFDELTYTEQNEISIKMPQDDFERFLRDFNHSLDMYRLARANPMIREELDKLLMLVELYK